MPNLKPYFMKYILCTLLIVCSGFGLSAQNTRPVLSAGNHATLDSVLVSYHAAPSDTTHLNDIYVKPEVLVMLKPGGLAEKIFIEIRNRQSNALLYAVNYALDAAPYTANGELLFSGQGKKYVLSCPLTLPLNSYVYKIYTADAQGTHSSIFSTRQ